MKFKTGVDIVEISRFSIQLLSNQTFLNLCFTPLEQTYCLSKANPAQHFAARFAAKEAVIKALSGFSLYLEHKKIEIGNNTDGRPYVIFLTDDPLFNTVTVDISLSHSDASAIAFVIITLV